MAMTTAIRSTTLRQTGRMIAVRRAGPPVRSSRTVATCPGRRRSRSVARHRVGRSPRPSAPQEVSHRFVPGQDIGGVATVPPAVQVVTDYHSPDVPRELTYARQI